MGDKKVQRLANRVGEDLLDAIHMISFLAKGTPITYYGDELGIKNANENEVCAYLAVIFFKIRLSMFSLK